MPVLLSSLHCESSSHRLYVLRWKGVRLVGSALTAVSDHHEERGPCPQAPKCLGAWLWPCLMQAESRRSSSLLHASVRNQNASADCEKQAKLHLERASFLQPCGADGKPFPAILRSLPWSLHVSLGPKENQDSNSEVKPAVQGANFGHWWLSI